MPEHRTPTKVPKRRFSWENLIKTPKKSKLLSKRSASNKLNMSISFNASAKSKASKSTFKTSTPLKELKPTPATANKSNASTAASVQHNSRHNEAQSTTCGDRMGSPKTSLNEFKKLLLNATNKKALPSAKPSAVEQLKLRQDASNVTPMKILDMSSSPKLFTNRRLLQIQASPSSPYKKINVMSPRSRWKHSNFNKSYISSIPEANVEDEIVESKPIIESRPLTPKSNSPESSIYATPPKISPNSSGASSEAMPSPPTAASADAQTESSPETGVLETSFRMEDNYFLQFDENNFAPGEVRPYGLKYKAAPKQLPIVTQKTSPSQSSDSTSTATSITPPSLETSF